MARSRPNLRAVFLEVTFPNELAWLADAAKHLTPQQFARERGKIDADVPVLAVHLKARYRDQVAAELAALAKSSQPVAEVAAADQAPAADRIHLLKPTDAQEVWAAGVTYERSRVAREEESAGSGIYDRVYTAERPEIFLKATPSRTVGPYEPVVIRSDARWNVPEPELALVISPDCKIVGYTIGNDMSSRDIEGENPLYLPQAKVYKQSCAVGPLITPVSAMPALPGVEIKLVIARGGKTVFEGTTTLAQMARTPESLADWLFRENEFPRGAILLTSVLQISSAMPKCPWPTMPGKCWTSLDSRCDTSSSVLMAAATTVGSR